MNGLPELSPQQRAKLSQRLGQKNILDDGSLTRQMAAALRVESAAARLSAVVAALSDSRLLIPVFPHATDSHENHTSLTEQLVRVELDGVQLISAFSSVAELSKSSEVARPVPIPVQQLAMAAALANQPVVIDRRPDLVVPLSALAALATGDTWVAPWDDEPLNREMTQVLEKYPALRALRFLPSIDGTVLELLVDINISLAREQVTKAVQEFRELPRVGAACGKLSVIPKPVVAV
ncbi:SseB family protein [Boudabousia marimammalium]|uniref:SseB protein N-terminal domain-containing protein n=1 Tax=Boudabousia marimammalium TaxID=156892 RepID=A0A1Q5PNT2_9ACTO|nr:SseB family protein [Boudabousia marimammalium]OKL49231.1 hypothetical protein BM477_04370 [Boudabousia marimammalium]